MMKHIFFTVFLAVFVVQAQSSPIATLPDLISEYEMKDIKSYCWVNSKFNGTEVPEQFSSASAVFLRYENSIELNQTTKNRKKYTFLTHRKIKLMDAAAVERFSELQRSDFGSVEFNYQYTIKSNTEYGARVIKEDGTIEEVDMSDFYKTDKLAIKNLEKGDILDFFYYKFLVVADVLPDNFPITFDRFVMYGYYPILNFEYKIVTDENWKINLINKNKAVKQKVGHVPNQKNMFRFVFTRDQLESSENDFWFYPYQEEAFVKFVILNSKNFLSKREKEKQPLIVREVPKKELITKFKPYFLTYSAGANEYEKFRKYLKRNNKTSLSDHDFIKEYYYFLRHYFITKHFFEKNLNRANKDLIPPFGHLNSNNKIIMHLTYGLKRKSIPYTIALGQTRSLGNIDEIIHVDEADLLLVIESEPKLYITEPYFYTKYGQVPGEVEGSKAMELKKIGEKSNALNTSYFNFPVSSHQDNKAVYESSVFIKPDMSNVEVSTKMTLKGLQNSDLPHYLVNWLDMVQDEAILYGSNITIDSKGKSKKKGVQIDAYRKDISKVLDENRESFVKNHFDSENLLFKEYKDLAYGNGLNTNDYQSEFKCEIDGLIKKVGPNYVLKVGKLVGGQLSLDQDALARKSGVHMKYARSYHYILKINIPEGYEVKGLSNLSNNVDNETGSLISSASIEENTLVVHFDKKYKHNYEPLENWGLMKEFIIAGDKFGAKEILLKKIK